MILQGDRTAEFSLSNDMESMALLLLSGHTAFRTVVFDLKGGGITVSLRDPEPEKTDVNHQKLEIASRRSVSPDGT